MAVTNINGTPGRVSYQAIYGVGTKLPMGRIDTGSGDDADGVVLGVDTDYGRIDGPSYRAGSILNRTIGVPSGYTVNGVPTYGDGEVAVTTNWAADHSVGPSGSFRYFSPLSPAKKLFSALT